jgi:hypothetical protein
VAVSHGAIAGREAIVSFETRQQRLQHRTILPLMDERALICAAYITLRRAICERFPPGARTQGVAAVVSES